MQFKITNGTFSYGVNTILKSIDFEIKDGEKIAICGRNGSGKTTLLKLITGELELDTNIDKVDSSIIKIGINQIGYLKQIAFTDESITLEEEILKMYSSIICMEKKLDDLRTKLERQPTDKNIEAFTALEQKFNDEGGYYYKKEYNSILKAFKFTEEDKHKKLSEFSGGQKTKIAFIKLVLSKPDILLFDEPTNHLDIDSIEWLEEYLASYKKSLVVISHDRNFLDNVANIVYEIEYGKITRYVGNYSDFVKQKNENYEKMLQSYKEQQVQIKKEEALIEKFRYKATKASMVQSRIKALDKIEKIESPISFDKKSFHFNLNIENSGKEVLTVNDLKIGYNDSVLAEINLKIMRGEKLGIIGQNGIGKSTLLKTLANKIPSLGGEFVFGHNTQIGYFEQQANKHTSEKTIYQDYIDEFPNLTETQARTDLGSFLFSKEDIYKQLNELSGGEMVRLELLKIFKRNPNVLLLDEPTNHLDLVGKEKLEEILENYQGTILVVSHDRYFIKKITTSLLVFENNNIRYYQYGYKEYLEKKHKGTEGNNKITKNISTSKTLTQNNIDFLKNKEKERTIKMAKNLEEKIKNLESEIENLKMEINTPQIYEDVNKLLQMNKDIETKENELLVLLEKWDNLT